MSVKHTITACVMMFITLVFMQYLNQAEAIHPRKSFETFPTTIGDWKGREDRFSQKVYDVLGVDDSFLCNYYKPGNQQIQLYIGFYQSQREGDLIHSPRNCMPGAGWNITKSFVEEISLPDTTYQDPKMIILLLEKGANRQIMLYWFHSRGRIISSEYMQKIYLVIDSITRKRTDGSFVRLIAPVMNNEDTSQALERMKEFAKKLIPILEEYIPS